MVTSVGCQPPRGRPVGHRSTPVPQSTMIDAMAHERAGQPALPEDLIDVDAVISAYYDRRPGSERPRSAGGVRHLGASRLEP